MSDNISLIEEVAQLAPQDLAKLRIVGAQKIILHIPTQKYPQTCPNCGGAKFIYFRIIENQKTSFPGFKPHTYWGGGWHENIESFSFQCPICTDPNEYHSKKINFLLSNSGLLPNEYDWKVNFINGMEGKTNALNVALHILSELEFSSGLFLFYGNYGTGKSGLLKSLVAQFCNAGVSAKYITSANLLSMIRATFKDGVPDTESAIMTDLNTFKLLAIDEVDVISQTEFAQTAIRTLIDNRYNSRTTKTTLFATNKKPSDLWGYFTSRMDDGSNILLGGNSLRGERQMKDYADK